MHSGRRLPIRTVASAWPLILLVYVSGLLYLIMWQYDNKKIKKDSLETGSVKGL